MKKIVLILMAGAFLCAGCTARQQVDPLEIQAKNTLMEMLSEAEQAQTAYLACLESATSPTECACLKEIAKEKMATFQYWQEEWRKAHETKDMTITVKKPWWQILLERGRRR